MKPLAITGFSVVSPLGIGRDAWLTALRDPKKASAEARRGASEVLDPEHFSGASTAEVWGWDPKVWLGPKGHRNYDRLTKFLIAAAGLALEDAGIKEGGAFNEYSPERVGVASATAYGSLDAITELSRISNLEDPRYINPTRFPNTVINAAAGYVSIWEKLQAPNTTIVDGNCGALDAVLNAETHLAHRRGDAFLVGGGEVVSEALYVALDKLGVLGLPGEGFTIGEGACYLVVERAEDAKKRAARIEAEIIGYGTAFEPPESEALLFHGSATAIEHAMSLALEDAGVSEIDLVVGAQSGLEELDYAELAAINALLGKEVAVAAPKRIIGETFGAAGAFGIASSMAWSGGCPLPELIQGRAPTEIKTLAVNSVGFYGNASTVILRKP